MPVIPKTQSSPIHLVIDSTGLKMLGDGEWHSLKHKTSNKSGSWRKLHLAVHDHGFIVTSELTSSGADDATASAAIIKAIDDAIERFTADGAYDTRAIYKALTAVAGPGAPPVLPPRKTASPSKPAEELFERRDAALTSIDEVGRRHWRKESGAHQQAKGENAIFRYKRLIGDRIQAKTSDAQVREAKIGGNILNKMAGLGSPESARIVA